MKQELRIGTYAVGQNEIYRCEGCIKEIRESSDTKKGKIYNIGDYWFFAEDITALNFKHSPREYYDIMKEMQQELVSAVRNYGKALPNDCYIYRLKKSNRPCVSYGNENINIKDITIRRGGLDIEATADNGITINALYDAEIILWSYWHIYDDIEKLEKKAQH